MPTLRFILLDEIGRKTQKFCGTSSGISSNILRYSHIPLDIEWYILLRVLL